MEYQLSYRLFHSGNFELSPKSFQAAPMSAINIIKRLSVKLYFQPRRGGRV